MKYIKLLLLVLIPGILAFSSCSKKSAPQPTVTASMSFKLNGTSKNAATVFATYYSTVDALQVIGQVTDSEGIELQIDSIKVGTFNATAQGIIMGYSPDAAFQDIFFATSGSVTISTYNNTTVAGTFSFTGVNSLNVAATISAGTFSAQIIKD